MVVSGALSHIIAPSTSRISQGRAPGKIILQCPERSVVTRPIHNAFRERELDPESTGAKFAQVQSEGGRTVSRQVDHFNTDVIISVSTNNSTPSSTMSPAR
jgi:hypothetical protein